MPGSGPGFPWHAGRVGGGERGGCARAGQGRCQAIGREVRDPVFALRTTHDGPYAGLAQS